MTIPVLLIHYHEIALKGKNRSFFENNLKRNLLQTLPISPRDFFFEPGRIVISLKKQQPKPDWSAKLQRIFGIAYFSFAFQIEKSRSTFKKAILSQIKLIDFKSFKITTRRADKKFPQTSQELNDFLGQTVADKTKATVNLSKPELEIFLEIAFKHAYLYFKKIPGPGGLPVSSAGKLLGLLSGGIDSPTAAYLMMKRGAHVDLIHFHSYPQTNQESINKVQTLVKILTRWQPKTKLYLIPFLSLQKKIFKNCDHRLLVILYRRAMHQISQKIAFKNNYQGLVTGESLSQVASQTLPNLAATSAGLKLPLYRPLIGFDKQEIINLAQKIGTYPISIQPHQDCCQLFVPRHPTTRAKLEEVLTEEKKANLSKLMSEAFKNTKPLEIRN
ncbi:tRNA uracil 4-sulfurtransferase ThiI [Patescibacteria group bacterium]